MDLMDTLFPPNDNSYPISVLLLILYLMCPISAIEILLHPKKWITHPIQAVWNETMVLLAASMPNLLTTLMNNMKMSCADLPVSCTLNLSPEYIDTSAPLLYRVELMEYRGVCTKWTNLLEIPAYTLVHYCQSRRPRAH